jgi:hypothetical protein
MMGRKILGAAIVMLTAATVTAQTNTTGSLSQNRPILQTQTTQGTPPGTTPPGTTTIPGATTPGTTTSGTTITPGGTATTSPPTASPTGTPRDAAILVCGEDISTGVTRLVVFSASTSAGAPTIAAASPCAQALADLFVAGFGLLDVQPLNQQLQYTMVR